MLGNQENVMAMTYHHGHQYGSKKKKMELCVHRKTDLIYAIVLDY